MEKKLFVFDIDGTLLKSDNSISAGTVDSINDLRKNHYIMLATGRSLLLTIELIRKLDINHYILCNGSAAFVNNKQIYKNTLDKNRLDVLLEYFQLKEVDVAFMGLDSFFRNSSYRPKDMEAAMESIGGTMPEYLPSGYLNKDIYQVIGFYEETNDSNLESEFSDFNFVRWHDSFVDIIPKGGSKAVTMLKVAKKLNVSVDNIIAFGDGSNDVDMLKMAGMGIAMGNANEDVKLAADYVTTSNDEDGIVNAIKKLELI